MVKVFLNDQSDEYPEYDKKQKKVAIKQEEENRDYLDIWKINPSFKDVHIKYSIGKTIFVITITLAIILSMYVMTHLLLFSVGVGIMFCVGFTIVFHDEFYFLRYFFRFLTRGKTMLNPFEDFAFWYTKEDLSTLYMSNRKDAVHIVLRIYQIKVIAENVEPAIKQFVKALSLSNGRISYSYQIVQKPITILSTTKPDRDHTLKSLHSRGATIYFSVYTRQKGHLTNRVINKLQYTISQYSNNLKSSIVSNFHHFQAVLLSGSTLMNAVRTFYLKDRTPIFESTIDKKGALHSNNSHMIWKFLACIGLLLYFDYFFFHLRFHFFYILAINAGFIFIFIVLWWRSLIYQVSKSKLIKADNIIVAKPFDGLRFYHIRKCPYSLFMHIDNHLLIGTKMVNLKYVRRRPFCLLGKFIESLNNHKINFSYTLKNRPISFYEFYENGRRHLRETPHTVQYKLSPSDYAVFNIQNRDDENRWLRARSGMWYTMLTMGVHSYRFIDASRLTDENLFLEMENELIVQIDALRGAFNLNFQAYEIEEVRTTPLISGILFTALKQNLFRLNGTHLDYVMFQGANMHPLANIVNILKKGARTEIAAEFNTPLYLENDIMIGYTINTEVLEREVPFGFTREQLNNLLIVNGAPKYRDLLAMKVVLELLKVSMPSIIFDFSGEWSRLLSSLENTPLQKTILYFRYRSSFIVDPIKSDIPYDKHHSEYLEYIYHAFGLALKKEDRTVEMFRQTIQRNPEMDLSSINMSLKNQSEWERSSASDHLLTIFADFAPDELNFFKKENVIANDFVSSNKTIIIDLSIFNELKKKLFVTFVILSKLIHYCDHHDDYHPKIVYIPYLDNIFDSFFLDRGKNYDKIDIFLEPLVKKGFGLICSAHQIKNLHPNALHYFLNYMTLRATNKSDIAILRNVMNLQEFEGTGYYSTSRKHAYQLQYLKNMRDNIALVRRNDIDQPFPVIIDWKDIQRQPPLPYKKIAEFMESQGYDVKTSEKKILESAQETLFQIDLGHYYIYIKEIIKFMDYIQRIDKVGNLYTQKLKESLKEFLYPAISPKTQKKEHIKKIRDGILETLIRHGYLVEDHPKRAGGGEALRTSYSVGQRYHEALKDYWNVKGRVDNEFQAEVLDKESGSLDEVFPGQKRKFIIVKKDLKDALVRELTDLNYDMFKIYRYIEIEDFSNALKIEHELLKRYLMSVCRHYYNAETVVLTEFNSFLGVLGTSEGFPFTKQELINYIDKHQFIKVEESDIESLTKEIYQEISEFFVKLQNYIYGE